MNFRIFNIDKIYKIKVVGEPIKSEQFSVEYDIIDNLFIRLFSKKHHNGRYYKFKTFEVNNIYGDTVEELFSKIEKDEIYSGIYMIYDNEICYKYHIKFYFINGAVETVYFDNVGELKNYVNELMKLNAPLIESLL